MRAGNRGRRERIHLKIAEIILAVEDQDQGQKSEIEKTYRPFLTSGNPDIHLQVHDGPYSTQGAEKLFDCPPMWSLYRDRDTNVIVCFPDKPEFQSALVFKRPLKKADLYVKKGSFDLSSAPALELLMINYLAQGHGLILHACGVVHEDKGILFVGDSGAGKSTMAGLWAGEKDVEVLSDDRTIVRKKGDEFWMYGTPWHGEGKFGSPGSAKVEKIFFISHGEENAVRDVEGVDAAARLLTCSFPPYWEPEGMDFTLGFISELTARVACREFSFRPDGSIVGFLKS
jgi:hypothetical protein